MLSIATNFYIKYKTCFPIKIHIQSQLKFCLSQIRYCILRLFQR